MGTQSAASRRTTRLLHFAASASKSESPFSRINPKHCRPRLRVDITRSTIFLQECDGAVLAAQRKSRSSIKKRAIKETCTDTYVSLWSGPPSLYKKRIDLWMSALELSITQAQSHASLEKKLQMLRLCSQLVPGLCTKTPRCCLEYQPQAQQRG